MGVFDFKQEATGNNWNYSDPQKPGYMESITGTVVEIHAVYATKFNSNQIDTFPDGNPKINYVLVIQGQSGQELRWTVTGGKKSLAMQALKAAMPNADSMLEVAGKMVTITTQAGNWNSRQPRPWQVQVLGQGSVPYRGTFDDTNNGQAPVQQPAQQAQPQVQQQANGFNAPVQQQTQPQMQQPQQMDNGFAALAQQQQTNTVFAQSTAAQAYADEDIPF